MLKSKRLPAEKRKKMILRAAIDVFSESNYRVAKVTDIAARAGVTDPMIYKFYQSKKELFVEVLAITTRKSSEKFGIENFIQPDQLNCMEDLKAALEKSLSAYLTSMKVYHKELKIFYRAISEIDDPEVEEVIQGQYKRLANKMELLFQRAIDLNLLSGRHDAKTIAWDIVGFFIQQNVLFLAGLYDHEQTMAYLSKKIQFWLS